MNNRTTLCLLGFMFTKPLLAETVAATETATIEVGRKVGENLNASSMILSLLMVLALIIVCAVVLKKFNFHQGQSSELKVVTSLHLSAKEKLVVVQVAQEQLLLGVTGQQINLLKTLDEPLHIKTPANQQLASSIQQFLKKQP